MKCGFCGNELEKGSEICPNCGMIISLGDENEGTQDKVVESVYNVFKSNVTNEKKDNTEKAQELEADPTEEKVEFIMSLPEFDEAAEPIKGDEATVDAAPEVYPAEEDSDSNIDKAEENEIDISLPEMEDIPLPETLMGDRITGEIYSNTPVESQDIPKEAEKAEEAPTEEKAEAIEEAPTQSEEAVEEATQEVTKEAIEEADGDSTEEKEEKLGIRVPESNYIYAEYDDYVKNESDEEKQEKSERQQQAKKNLDKISPDEKKKVNKGVKRKKKNKNNIDGIKIEAVLAVAIVIIAVLFGCAYAAKKNMIPTIGELFAHKETTESVDMTDESTEAPTKDLTEDSTEDSTEEATEDSTKESKTEESTKESTTKESTTKPTTTESTKPTDNSGVVSTTKPTTTKPSTTKPTTTKPSTTKPSTTKPSTTKPSTTKPNTTKPNTTKPSTTKPSTTKPNTTKPTTTKPSTTKDPYGINNVKVQKPSSYLSKSYTAYVTAEGVILRNKPSSSSEKILCLSKGADVKVLAKQGSFYYIYSNRYGVYGWVSTGYIANERPTANSSVVNGTVSPDKKYDTAQIKYTTNGLNVRKGPGTNYGIIGLVPISYPVKVIGYKSGVSGWVYVVDLTYGYTGWVSTAYLK